MKKSIKFKIPNLLKTKRSIVISVLVAVIIVSTILVSIHFFNAPSPESFFTTSTLKNMISTSELSTFEALYNGIAIVENPNKPDKIDYHVSYEARIKAGIDFDKIDVSVNSNTKQIFIHLPPINILDTIVDIGSLDFIFDNNKANTSTVAQQAYKACIEDVTRESANQKAIYKLAAQNAENIIEALTRPLIDQLDETYSLSIEQEGTEL